MAICTVLDSLLIDNESVIKTKVEEEQKVIYEAFFIYAGMWAIGGCFGGG
jgi:dynein heavy chain